MKKTMRYIAVAALALVGIAMMSCSENDLAGNSPEGKTVTLTTTISLDGSSTTRALDADGKKTFAEGEQIALIYESETDGALTTQKVVSAALQESDISNEGKTAILTFKLEKAPKEQGLFSMFYPALRAPEDGGEVGFIDYGKLLGTQDGTFNSLATGIDFAYCEDKFTTDGLLPGNISLANELAILELTIKDNAGTDITSKIDSLNIKQGVSNTYAVKREAAAGPIYVATMPTPTTESKENLIITATDGTNTYEKDVNGVSLQASSIYPVKVTMPEFDPVTAPLTLEAAVAGAVVTFYIKVATGEVQYRVNGGNWSAYESETPITLANVGDKVMFRGDNATYANETTSSRITCSKDCYVYGNIMSLISSTDYATLKTLTGDYAFSSLFAKKPTDPVNPIKSHPSKEKKLLLPATTLTKGCYTNMFYGCTGLTTAPALPATTLTESCYAGMFYGCTGLTTAPALPATKLTKSCYNRMFAECKGLTTTPVINADCDGKNYCMYLMFNRCSELTTVAEGSKFRGKMGENNCASMFGHCEKLVSVPSDLLPATELGDNCYSGMFSGCSSLKNAPNLPAETLKIGCYDSMFNGCSSLEKAPCLPAVTLTERCYYYMFRNCTKLNEVWVKADYVDGEVCKEMFYGCTNASTSKFYTDGNWDSWKAAFPNINNWTNYPYMPGLSPGKFSVSSTQKVCFSQGNLQYQASSNTWRFAENQYDYVGDDTKGNVYVETTKCDNALISSTYSGWIDLFGWGTSGYNHDAVCYQPYSTSTSSNDYFAYGNSSNNLYDGNGQADWGYNKISNGGNTENSGWRTLTKGEWVWLLGKNSSPNPGTDCRTSSTIGGVENARWVKATVHSTNGLIIFPDVITWNTSTMGDAPTTSNNESDAYTYSPTDANWTALESAGCVFLPAAGYRSGSKVTDDGAAGYYWSSTYGGSIDAYVVGFKSDRMDSYSSGERYKGFSVRLVRNVE